MAYVLLKEVRAYIGDIDAADMDDDSLLTDMIASAKVVIDGIAGWTFEAVTETRYFDALGIHIEGRTLHLDGNNPLLTITTVTNGDSVVVSSSEYTTKPKNQTPYNALRLLPSSNKRWTYSGSDYEDAISIVGTWGYSAAAPENIKTATLRLVSYLYKQRNTSLDIARPKVSPTGVVKMPGKLPSDIETLIGDMKRIRI